jgi:galactokinase
MKDFLKVIAPGRICLFGEHQDFLGLGVIALAINLHIKISGKKREDSFLYINMPDINEREIIDLSKPIYYNKPRDYIRSVINVLKRQGFYLKHGYDVEIKGDIPINAGTSSSSALVIAWIKFILSSLEVELSKEEIARIGYLAEVLEFNEPGGMMDHFTSSIGGVIYVDSNPPFSYEKLSSDISGFVLADSLERKKTLDVLKSSKERVLEGIKIIKEKKKDFDLRTTPTEEALELANKLPKELRSGIIANIYNRDICREAYNMFKYGIVLPEKLGQLLTEHHYHLSLGLNVSTPKLDKMVEIALLNGALGAKLNGSGGGGCMFAYAPGCEEEVAYALEEIGAKSYIVKIDEGVREIK